MPSLDVTVEVPDLTRRIARLVYEHAVMLETLREIRDLSEPEPWESPSEVHQMASDAAAWAGDPMDVGA